MNQLFFMKKIQELWKLTISKRAQEEETPEARENDVYRADMRGQFQKLRDKGLSIRIVTL